ncbi:Protein CBG12797 [Caenorhabditis briggsae]|uniref:Protein CBG12797 n=2 Tax=Caenorhabditis briggsae TaxID=6238 RepID=A8XGL3_CAEBR|nr:Protein CBG12797 [Caenorhabditis briggsae]ULU13061.1 hypothetical protein L3Y34_015925 [Caenorhabditis briggsae]CAP31719.1 Protein CBG12797 [Caenorhabditis briggsae]
MSTCHLESLPFVPLCRLLKAMSIYNLVQLSRTGKLWKEEIQKMRVIQSGGYKICIDEIGSSIEMSKQDCKFYWNRKEKSKLLGYVLGCYRYLSTIFPGGINHLKICPTHISDFEKIPNECQVLSIGINSEIYMEWDLESLESFSNLDILLNHVNFQKGLSLNGPKLLIPENSKMLEIDWLKVENSGSFTSSILRKLRNKIANLSEVQLNETEVNGYLWDLKQGNGNEKLQIMTIQKENGKWNEEEVIEGLNTYRVGKQIYYLENYDPLIESEDFLPYHSENRICISDSYEFRRADGIRCTIEIRYSTIQIFVCNQ